MPEQLWDLPLRIERANAAGPRFNQTELAAKCDLSQSVISKLANRANLYGIRLETLYKLASALDVSVPYLLGETTARRKPAARGKGVTVGRASVAKRPARGRR